jgi:hypothetical protein
MMNSTRWTGIIVLLVLCATLAACSDNPEPVVQTEPAASTATSTPAGDSTPAVTVDVPNPTPETALVQPSEPELPLDIEVDVEVDLGIALAPEGIFAGANEALEALDSYRFTTVFLFTGEEDGKIESGSIELSGEIMDAQHKHFVWRNLEDGGYFEIIQLEDAAWVYDDGEWESVPLLVADAMSQAVLVFAPSVVWGGLFGSLEANSAYVGSETVDGMLAHHYTSTYQQWAGYWQGEVLDASGDVWIADAGYPIRYNFTATGVGEDGGRGAISWTMELTDVGADIAIEPPM